MIFITIVNQKDRLDYVLDSKRNPDFAALAGTSGFLAAAKTVALDCACHVLHIWQRGYPYDKRPWQAIEASRRYLNGEASDEELDWAAKAVQAAVYAEGVDRGGRYDFAALSTYHAAECARRIDVDGVSYHASIAVAKSADAVYSDFIANAPSGIPRFESPIGPDERQEYQLDALFRAADKERAFRQWQMDKFMQRLSECAQPNEGVAQ